MARPGPQTHAKRQREQAKKEKRRAKEEKKALRKAEKMANTEPRVGLNLTDPADVVVGTAVTELAGKPSPQ